MTTNSTETTVRALADRAELADLVARHSVWLDELRYDESDQLFTADVVVRSPRGQSAGLPAMVELARAGHDRYARTQHNKSNLVIAITGDTATVRAHDFAVYVLADGDIAFAAAVHEYGARRTADGWRFDRLAVLPTALTTSLPAAPVPAAAAQAAPAS
ncbi:MAG TPA: nuclear transport factor 2 family protein [Jatrophihabitantaceae bacterium]|jgi:hypothetical protein|nr:nuclear transport factor 2 family protein [Jatrophihabitantaceae bacterium]